MNYLELLKNSYAHARSVRCCPPEYHMEYLGDSIFGFTTYDSEQTVFFAEKAVEVVEAITNGTTFKYIEDADNYRWYLLMCNMQFFAEKLDWGSSIRGAWWEGSGIKFQTCELWDGEKQLYEEMTFTREEWEKFMKAVVEFSMS